MFNVNCKRAIFIRYSKAKNNKNLSCTLLLPYTEEGVQLFNYILIQPLNATCALWRFSRYTDNSEQLAKKATTSNNNVSLQLD